MSEDLLSYKYPLFTILCFHFHRNIQIDIDLKRRPLLCCHYRYKDGSRRLFCIMGRR